MGDLPALSLRIMTLCVGVLFPRTPAILDGCVTGGGLLDTGFLSDIEFVWSDHYQLMLCYIGNMNLLRRRVGWISRGGLRRHRKRRTENVRLNAADQGCDAGDFIALIFSK